MGVSKPSKSILIIGFIFIHAIVLVACQALVTPTPVGMDIYMTVIVPVQVEGEQVVKIITPTPEPTTLPDTLVICLANEPDSLYPLAVSTEAALPIFEAIYDGPIDSRTYDHQAVILEKLPSLADGDATVQTITVTEGDMVVAADGSVAPLTRGLWIIPSGGSQPEKYTGGEILLDQMIALFRMRPDLKWSDGTPLTAQDSLYAFNLQADPITPGDKVVVEHTASYQAVDDRTLQWTGLPGYKDPAYYANFFYPLPEHTWGQYKPEELPQVEQASERPLGWGPYRIEEWTRGDHITLTRNPNYYRAGEGLPRFEYLVFRFIGNDSSSNLAVILSGECDIVDKNAHLEQQLDLLLDLQASGLVKAVFGAGPLGEYLDFGIQHSDFDNGYNPIVDKRPDFLSDVRVRRAIAYCLNRQAVVDDALFGQSLVLDTILPPNHPLFNPQVSTYPYNPGKGKSLLAEAGWADRDGDGVVEAQGVEGVPDGVKFILAYESTDEVDYSTQRNKAMQILANSLSECGIQTNLQVYPRNEWLEPGPQGKLFGRGFDLAQVAWQIDFMPLCSLYSSDQVPGRPDRDWIPIMDPQAGRKSFPIGWEGSNVVGFYSPEYDTACGAAMSALPGQPEYKANYLKVQEIFSDKLPAIPLYLNLRLSATRPDMCGFNLDPTTKSEFWNIEEYGYGPLCK
jgi:peptide/nickel transport system substrate-binding protein